LWATHESEEIAMIIPPDWLMPIPIKKKKEKTYIPIHKKRRIKRRKK